MTVKRPISKAFIILSLFAILLLGFSTFGFSTIYYVNTAADAGGDGTTQELTGEHCAFKTIAQVIAASPAAGDSILFNKGNTWREQLTVPSSGSSGAPIIIGSYGSGNKPIINASDLITGWTNDSGNIWKVTLATEPGQIFFDSTRGTKETSKANLDSEKEWYWDANILYVYSTSDPDTAYNNPGIEASTSYRGQCISIHEKQYIEIRDLNLRNAYLSCLDMYNSSYINVYDNDISRSRRRGIYTNNTNNIKIYRNTFQWCGIELATLEHAIYIGTDSSNVNVYENDVSHSWNAGVKADSCSDVDIYRNYIHENNDEGSAGAGDIIVAESAADTSNINIYYNIIANPGAYIFWIKQGEGYSISNVHIYNNTLYGSLKETVSYVYIIQDVSNLSIKNNIVYANSPYVMLYEDNTNFTRDFNCYYNWSSGAYIGYIDGSWVTWSDVSSIETNSINQNSLFIDTGNNDFHLQSTSPCINAGTDVSLTEDYEGTHVFYGFAPDIGAYELAMECKSIIIHQTLNPIIAPIIRAIIK